MRVSYNWLQSYFDAILPPPQELVDILTFHAFEIDGIEQQDTDTVIDVDVLPNRSSDCLSHRGIAREIATLLNVSLKDDPLKRPLPQVSKSEQLSLDIQNQELVHRFSAAVISNVRVEESPPWLKDRLAAVGQKSINRVVDATNYVMFDLGQPLHAFDRDKLTQENGSCQIRTRVGKKDEKITTLSGDEYTVGAQDLLIVDGGDDTPIGIAGIKGGKKAEVTSDTTNLIIEAANFSYTCVRTSSKRLKLSTDASLRFQNQPSPELTLHAIREVVALIGGTLQGVVDHYPTPQQLSFVEVHLTHVTGLLGTTIHAKEMESILQRLGFSYRSTNGESFMVNPPWERTDINIPEDVIEEIGRVHGYAHITAKRLPPLAKRPSINKRFYYREKISLLLSERGFSEVYTYTLRDHGEVAIENPLARDKGFLRSNLHEGVVQSLEENTRNAPLLGLETVNLFELGTIFTTKGERYALCLAGKEEHIQEALRVLEKELPVFSSCKPVTKKKGVVEFVLDDMFEKLPEPVSYDALPQAKTKTYEPISLYPFMLRDIAVWVPHERSADEVQAVIAKQGGSLLVRLRLFDEYQKDDKISYAFHLVFQSHEKTLSDQEVNAIMETIAKTCEKNGWSVR